MYSKTSRAISLRTRNIVVLCYSTLKVIVNQDIYSFQKEDKQRGDLIKRTNHNYMN